jgi:hypothetical protein
MRHSLFVTTAALLLAGCSISVVASGEPITHNSDLPSFDRLEASRGVLVTLSCGPASKAVIRGDLKEVMDTDVHVEGRVLTVRRARMIGDDRPRVHVEVTTSQPLDHIEASSGSSVDAPSCALSPERLDLEASSGATLDLAVNTHHLTAEASSGGTISRLEGARIDATEADLHASSGGTVRVCSVGRPSGRASSGGAITSESSESGDRSSSSGGDFSTRRCS